MLKRAAPTHSPERRSTLPKATLGTKRICPNCHQPFYDLSKSPAHCPNCAHVFDPTEVLKSRRGRGNEPVAKAEEVKPVKAPVADAEVAEVGDVPEAEEGEEADEDVLEDASDLGEDEDDVAEVIENVDEGGEER
jgi:uncharacterized protein (TIGR02300 family)